MSRRELSQWGELVAPGRVADSKINRAGSNSVLQIPEVAVVNLKVRVEPGACLGSYFVKIVGTITGTLDPAEFFHIHILRWNIIAEFVKEVLGFDRLGVGGRENYRFAGGRIVPAIRGLAGMALGNLPNAHQVFADPTHGLVIDADPLPHSPVAGLWLSSQFPGDQFTNLGLCQLAAVEVQYQSKVRSLG